MTRDQTPAARLILADSARYGPHGSLMLRWAVLVLARHLYPAYAQACAEAEAVAERRASWGDWRDGMGACIGFADWRAEAELIAREAAR